MTRILELIILGIIFFVATVVWTVIKLTEGVIKWK